MTIDMTGSAIGRRQFLRQAAQITSGLLIAGTATHSHHSVSAALPNAPGMTFGFSLYGMQGIPTEDALRTLHGIGYDSAELCLTAGFDADPRNLDRTRRQSIREILGETGLRIPALMENLPFQGTQADTQQSHERLNRAAELAHELVPDAPPLIETILGGGEWETVKQRFVDGVSKWAELAERRNVVIAIKPHRFGAMNRPEHAVWLLKQVNHSRIVLVYDYSHFAHRDLAMSETLTALLPYTRFVHIKDTVLVDGKPRFVLPGESGQVDYPAMFRRLKAAGYEGDICVEVSGMVWKQPAYDPAIAARTCYDRLAPMIATAGVTRPASD